jgi:hypothetical protein
MSATVYEIRSSRLAVERFSPVRSLFQTFKTPRIMVRFLASCCHRPSSILAAFVDFINVSITRRHVPIFSDLPVLSARPRTRHAKRPSPHSRPRPASRPPKRYASVSSKHLFSPHIAGSVHSIHHVIHTAAFALLFVRQEHVQLHCTLPPIAKLDNSLNSLVKCQKLSLSTNQIDKFISLASLSTRLACFHHDREFSASNCVAVLSTHIRQIFIFYFTFFFHSIAAHSIARAEQYQEN